MIDDTTAWAAPLGLPADQITAFSTLASRLGTQPAALLRRMAERVLTLDRDLAKHGLGGVRAWVLSPTPVVAVVTDAAALSLGLPADQITAFSTIASSLSTQPAVLLRRMVERVLALDRDSARSGPDGVTAWMLSPTEIAEELADEALTALGLAIRPSGFMWPADKPFPWSKAECKAAVLGYEVKWPGDFDDFLRLLRGKWEMSDGYAVLHQS
jgi:hypothetical protein